VNCERTVLFHHYAIHTTVRTSGNQIKKGDWVKSATNPWLVLCPFWIFFKICAPKKTNNAAPSCAASPPRGTGSIAMPRYYLYRGQTQVQVIRHYRNRGMPERWGRRLAGAPKSSGNKIFVSGLSNFWWMLHNH